MVEMQNILDERKLLSWMQNIVDNLKHNAFVTHVTSFRLMTPRPVGLKALGVETHLRA